MSWRVHLPLLSLGAFLVLPGSPTPAPTGLGPGGAVCRSSAVLNEIVPLLPTGSVGNASGSIELKPLMSPFGVSVTPEGRYVFDATITVKNLPEPASLGPYTVWVVWLATPSLEKIRNLGAIKPGQSITARVDFTKMMYIVSAEQTAALDRFKGQLVLVGRSASARVQNLAGCDIYDEQSQMGG